MAASEVGVRQGCPLSPTLFNIFLERIKVSIGGRNITNLRFADDTDALAEEELELGALVQTLDKGCTKNKMEISAEKTKLLKKKKKKTARELNAKGQKLGTVTSFKYLGASDGGSKPEILTELRKQCRSCKAEDNMERYEHISWIKGNENKQL